MLELYKAYALLVVGAAGVVVFSRLLAWAIFGPRS